MSLIVFKVLLILLQAELMVCFFVIKHGYISYVRITFYQQKFIIIKMLHSVQIIWVGLKCKSFSCFFNIKISGDYGKGVTLLFFCLVSKCLYQQCVTKLESLSH